MLGSIFAGIYFSFTCTNFHLEFTGVMSNSLSGSCIPLCAIALLPAINKLIHCVYVGCFHMATQHVKVQPVSSWSSLNHLWIVSINIDIVNRGLVATIVYPLALCHSATYWPLLDQWTWVSCVGAFVGSCRQRDGRNDVHSLFGRSESGVVLAKPFLDVCKQILPVFGTYLRLSNL
jgi:hypothetical protein